MIEMFYLCAFQYGNHLAMGLLGIWNIASVTEKLSFKLHLILVNLNLDDHMWLVAITLDSSAPECRRGFGCTREGLKTQPLESGE